MILLGNFQYDCNDCFMGMSFQPHILNLLKPFQPKSTSEPQPKKKVNIECRRCHKDAIQEKDGKLCPTHTIRTTRFDDQGNSIFEFVCHACFLEHCFFVGYGSNRRIVEPGMERSAVPCATCGHFDHVNDDGTLEATLTEGEFDVMMCKICRERELIFLKSSIHRNMMKNAAQDLNAILSKFSKNM